MDALGWDSCDIILVTGDAYIDHPSFGMALVGRLLESQGLRVGILAQPAWQGTERVPRAGQAAPVLGRDRRQHGLDGQPLHQRQAHPQRRCVLAGRRGGLRPDRSVIVYSQRCARRFPRRAASSSAASRLQLRRIAHYDYWSDKVRRSVLLDAKADLLVYGNAERASWRWRMRLDAP
jgi:radical SAM superfamily enzyme YgiQ (UPF0313 family)